MAKYIRSKTKRKILFLLYTGIAIGLTYHPRRQVWILKQVPKELDYINRAYISRMVLELRKQKLIDVVKENGGVFRVILTKQGKQARKLFQPKEIIIPKPKKWDKKWRIVIYDIPEEHRTARDTLRDQLKILGFYELQKSVWIFPYPCDHVFQFLVRTYEIDEYVHWIVADTISNQRKIQKHFSLR